MFVGGEAVVSLLETVATGAAIDVDCVEGSRVHRNWSLLLVTAATRAESN